MDYITCRLEKVEYMHGVLLCAYSFPLGCDTRYILRTHNAKDHNLKKDPPPEFVYLSLDDFNTRVDPCLLFYAKRNGADTLPQWETIKKTTYKERLFSWNLL